MIKKVLVFTLRSTAQIRWIYTDAVYVTNIGRNSINYRRGGQSIKIQAYSSQCTVSKFRIGLQPTSPLILAKFWSIRLLGCLPQSLVPVWNLGRLPGVSLPPLPPTRSLHHLPSLLILGTKSQPQVAQMKSLRAFLGAPHQRNKRPSPNQRGKRKQRPRVVGHMTSCHSRGVRKSIRWHPSSFRKWGSTHPTITWTQQMWCDMLLVVS